MSGLAPPPGRQGPGPMPAAAISALDLAIVRRAASPLPGEHRSAGVGAGTELAQLRPYVPGDDVRHLDAAATARSGIAHIRQHVPERALTTWIVLDLSPSMAFGTGERLKSDVAEGVVTVLARLGIRRGGRVAVVTFGAPVTRVLPPRGGRGALALVTRLVSEGVGPDGHVAPDGLRLALERVRAAARQPGLVVVVSDFRGDEGWERSLRGLGARHRVLCAEIADPRESELPAAGRLVLVDPESGRQVEADTSSQRLRRAFADHERKRRESVAAALRRAGAEHVALSTDGDWLRALAGRLR